MGRSEHSGRTDQRRAARKRLADGKALLACGRSHGRGAVYLAGYAIECELKAIAMNVFGCRTLEQLALKWRVDEREVFQHGLESLAKRLPLYDALRRSPVWRDFANYANQWRPAWRYNPHEPAPQYAEAFVVAVGRILRWLDAHH